MKTLLMLDLSTAHLPQSVLDGLNGYDGIIATPREFGALLWVPQDPDEHAAEYGDFPAEVLEIQQYARRNGCDYVLFDADADSDDSLPSWDWQTGTRTPARALPPDDGTTGDLHYPGDGCGIYCTGYTVETDQGMPNVEDLQDGDTWRDPSTDDTDVWWHADEVVVMADGDVHVAYSPA